MTQLSASVWNRPFAIPSSPASARAAVAAATAEAAATEEAAAAAVAAKKTELLNL